MLRKTFFLCVRLPLEEGGEVAGIREASGLQGGRMLTFFPSLLRLWLGRVYAVRSS